MKTMPNYSQFDGYKNIIIDGIIDLLNERKQLTSYNGVFDRRYVSELLIIDEDNNRIMDCFEDNLLEREAITMLALEVPQLDKVNTEILQNLP